MPIINIDNKCFSGMRRTVIHLKVNKGGYKRKTKFLTDQSTYGSVFF
jgi:hypothetical protein